MLTGLTENDDKKECESDRPVQKYGKKDTEKEEKRGLDYLTDNGPIFCILQEDRRRAETTNKKVNQSVRIHRRKL